MDVSVRVNGVGSPNLKAPTVGYAAIVFDDSFVVSDIRIIDGKNGLFISYPSKKDKREEGKFTEICHPLKTDVRETITNAILAQYEVERAAVEAKN